MSIVGDHLTETGNEGMYSVPEVTLDRLTKVYIKIRDKRSELTRIYEDEETRLKEQQAEIAAAMKEKLRAVGAKSAGTEYGTVTLKTNKRYYFTDWEEAYKFIIEHDMPSLLEKRVSQKNMEEFLESNPGMVPPGLNTMSELAISVTKPRK